MRRKADLPNLFVAEAPAPEYSGSKTRAVSFNCQITLAEIADKFSVTAEDEAWNEFETDMRRRIDQIKLTRELDYDSMQVNLELLTAAFLILNHEKARVEAYYQTFMDKTVGLIPRIQHLNATAGATPKEQERNVTLILEAVPVAAGKKTLYIDAASLTLALLQRKCVLEELQEALKLKQEMLQNYLTLWSLRHG